jgi:hypothetical protein
MPPDVRKGCAFPAKSVSCRAMPVYDLTAGVARKTSADAERRSLSAHQAAQPLGNIEGTFTTSNPTVKQIIKQLDCALLTCRVNNNMILITFLITCISFLQGQETVLLNEFVRQDISNERREELMGLILQQDINRVAPLLLKIHTEYATPTEPGLGLYPWLSDQHSVNAKIWYASGAIWQGLFQNEKIHNQTEILIGLLKRKDLRPSIYTILQTLRFYWNQEAERAVLDVYQTANETEGVRKQCSQILLEKNGQNYISHIAAHLQIYPKEKWLLEYNYLTSSLEGTGNPLTAENKNVLVKLGFQLLATLNEGNLSNGYNIARQLGRLLKISDEFAPDQKKAEYQGEGQLNDKFFADTVKNALKWRNEHLK